MGQNNKNAVRNGPEFKDQFREVSGEGRGRSTPSLNNNNNNADIPMIHAFAVESTNPGVTEPNPEPPSSNNNDSGTLVLKLTKSKLYWLLFGIIILIGAVVGGFCLSGKCRRKQETTRFSPGTTPSLRPVASPMAAPLVPTISSVPGDPTNPTAPPNLLLSNPPIAAGPLPPTANRTPTAAPVQAPVVVVAPTSPPTAKTPCSSNVKCLSGSCARESLDTQNLVCCSADFVLGPNGGLFCTGQPVGAACIGDSLCTSGVCYQNACLSGPQPGGSKCESNNGCTGACVQGICTEGVFAEVGGVCDDSADCGSGICGRATVSGGMICCPSGDYEFLSSPISALVCTGQLAGAGCGDYDSLCQSGACFQGLCQEGLQANGLPCDNNADCSGTCIGSICADGLQPPGANCDDKGDCSNQICGQETASSAKGVCCPSGRYEFLSSPISALVCTGQLAGAGCGDSDTICQSGACFQGLCQESLKANGLPCDNNADCSGTCIGSICADGLQPPGATCDDKGDCSNQICGQETASSAKGVCCPSGRYEFLSSPISALVCTGQLAGAGCGDSDTICQSGVCVQGLCS